jgi:hypothetical protein
MSLKAAVEPTLGSEVPGGTHSAFLRVRDLFELSRGHFPGAVAAYPADHQRHDGTACRILSRADIQPFALRQDRGRWIRYGQLRADFARWKREGRNRHGSPFEAELVFAPLKLLVWDSNRPLVGLLTAEPVYPGAAWMGRCRDLLQPACLQAAGVLNSALGLAAYHEEYVRQKNRPARPQDKIAKSVLDAVPLFPAEAPPGLIAEAARLARHLQALANPPPHLEDELGGEALALRFKLCSVVARLWGLDQSETERMLSVARRLGAADAPSSQMTLADALQRLPPLDLFTGQHAHRLTELERTAGRRSLTADELVEFDALQWRRGMEAQLGDLPPGDRQPTPTGWAREVALIARINRGLPEVQWRRYRELRADLDAERLTEPGRRELLELSDRLEALTAERAELLGELAVLRGTSLSAVVRDLGIGSQSGHALKA